MSCRNIPCKNSYGDLDKTFFFWNWPVSKKSGPLPYNLLKKLLEWVKNTKVHAVTLLLIGRATLSTSPKLILMDFSLLLKQKKKKLPKKFFGRFWWIALFCIKIIIMVLFQQIFFSSLWELKFGVFALLQFFSV